MEQSSAFLGAGKVSLDRLGKKGQSTGYKEMLDSAKCEIKVDSDEKILPSHRPENYGQTIASAVIPKGSAISLTFADHDAEIVAMSLGGTIEEINQPAGTLAAVEVKTIVDRWVKIGQRNLKDDISVKAKDGIKEYVKDKDYQIKYLTGMICALSDGEIPPDSVVKISGSAQAMEGKRIHVGKNTVVKAHVMLEGVNLVNQQDVIFEARDCTFKLNGTMDFLKNEFGECVLEGQVGETTIDYIN